MQEPLAKLTEDGVKTLLQQGAELWYLYMDGGVAVHLNGKPIAVCPIEVFLQLRESGVLTKNRRNETGYPWYANNCKSDVYKLVTEEPPIDPDSQTGKSLIHDFGEFMNWPGTEPTEADVEAYVQDYGEWLHVLDIESVGLDRVRVLLRTLIGGKEANEGQG